MATEENLPDHAGLSLESLVQLLTNHPPWWVYVVAALIPLSILYVLRESCCWFWKMNRAVDTLDRIERHLASISSRDSGADERPFTER